MATQSSWTTDTMAFNHFAGFERESAASANVKLDDLEFSGNGLPGIIGQSAALQRVLAMVRVVAPTGATVLINGGNGNRQGTDRGSCLQLQ
jgi:transcriptional regulator with GAF, ATPase, and Fis domain